MGAARTKPAKEEKVYATYMATGSYRETALKCAIPKRTVWDIVNRLGGDELAQDRLARRSILAEQIWERITDLVPAVILANLGVEGRSSVGLEAAKALDSLSRVIAVLEPAEEDDADEQPTTINVNVAMKPPRELLTSSVSSTTTTTYTPPTAAAKRGDDPGP